MNNKPIYKAWCKGTNREDSEPRYSQNWAFSRRGWFKVYADRVECGAWSIPLSEVKRAIVYRAKQMFIPVTVLHLITDNGSYQFGFNPWANPIRHLNMEFEEQKVRLRYSPFSVAIRIALVGYIGFLLWQEYGRT